MAFPEQEKYAKDLLLSLSEVQSREGIITFRPNPAQSRNAAKAMAAILCQRLFNKSGHRPIHRNDTTYEWKEGLFNCRNIADRNYLWTNIRRNVADQFHENAVSKAAAYMLAFSDPSEATLSVWALPEPIIYDSLSSLPEKSGGKEYTIQIFPDNQRIEHYAASPDLTQYFDKFTFSQQELHILNESREVDASVRQDRKLAREAEAALAVETEMGKLLTDTLQELDETGVFDPEGVTDARQRMAASIVRRRGQPVFRRRLITAYNGRCAFSGCDVEDVLEAAHIVPYKGPDTNHLGNGLLLRADIHTLFDLKLLAVDIATMTVIVSPALEHTCYGDYQGRPIVMPDDCGRRPSQEALRQHRQESGL